MKRSLRLDGGLAVTGLLAGSLLVVACSLAACTSSSDGSGAGNDAAPSDDASAADAADGSTTPGTDAPSGADAPTTDDAPSGQDAATDTGTKPSPEAGPTEAGVKDSGGPDAPADAPIDAPAESAAPSFCQTQTGLAFCADFDEPSALSLDGGATGTWTQLVEPTPGELTLSSAQSASAPDALLVSLPSGVPNDAGVSNGDRSTKVVEWLTPSSGVTQAIYEFDMYIDTVPVSASNPGGFATDFQFDDNGGADRFGFRISIFANATGFDHANLEHNHPNLGGNDDIVGPLPGFAAKSWIHVKMAVAFSALAGDAGNNVSFQLYLNHGATAAVDAQYPASFAKASFARFAAGMVFAFDGTNKGWGIYYDNFTLKLQ